MSTATEFCQSCAMPMSDPGLFGTNADGSKNSDYCKYCYQNGAFTADVDLDGMIETCVPHMVSANPGMTEDKAREMMRQYLPGLKRWKV